MARVMRHFRLDFFLLSRQFFGGNLAQFQLDTSESTYPSEIHELSHLRVATEHTVDIHWVFQGTAEVSRNSQQFFPIGFLNETHKSTSIFS